MHINRRHREQILNELHTALSKRPSDEFKAKAEAFLVELYEYWYKLNIEGHEQSALFPLLGHQEEVGIKAPSRISFSIPAIQRNKHGGSVSGIPTTPKHSKFYFNANLQTSKWDSAYCKLTLTSDQFDEYQALKQESIDIASKISDKVSAVETVLDSVRTFEQLKKNAPTVYEILPEHILQQIHVATENRKTKQRNRKAGKPEINIGVDVNVLKDVSQSLCIEKLLDDKD